MTNANPLHNIDRFYVTRFGTYRLEHEGVITRTLYLPDNFHDGSPETEDYKAILDEQQKQTSWKPVGIEIVQDYGTIFEPVARQ